MYLILAGGQARRMNGQCKLLLNIGGNSILDYLWRVIPEQATQHHAVALNSNQPEPALLKALKSKIAEENLPIIADADEFKGMGPLAGFLAGLDYAEQNGYQGMITLPSDTPFIPRDFAIKLLKLSKDGKAIISAFSDGRVHPVVSFLPTHVRDDLRVYLQADKRKITPFFERHDWQYCEFPMVKANNGQDYNSFMNINHAEDLQRAQAIAQYI